MSILSRYRARKRRTGSLRKRFRAQDRAGLFRAHRTKVLLAQYRKATGTRRARLLKAYRASRRLLRASRSRRSKLLKAFRASRRLQRKLRAAYLATRPNVTVAFDGVPVFRGEARALQAARNHGWGGALLSADRRKGVPEKYGKLSQAALYAGWIAHKLGFNPANPPGRSSHELRSDGVAYRGPIGRPLVWWGLGLDVSQSDELLRILRKLGYHVRRPYPTGSEAHHLNFTRRP